MVWWMFSGETQTLNMRQDNLKVLEVKRLSVTEMGPTILLPLTGLKDQH